MGFLIRCAFWLSLVLLAVPFGAGAGTDGQPAVGPLDALIAARAAAGDIAGLCEREPEVCVTGRAAFHTIAVRGQEVTRQALGLLDGGEAPSPAAGAAGVPAPGAAEAAR